MMVNLSLTSNLIIIKINLHSIKIEHFSSKWIYQYQKIDPFSLNIYDSVIIYQLVNFTADKQYTTDQSKNK